MRNHGWELPYHPLQTVAVAVFSGLSLSFYVFFIPFVGSSVMKFHVYAAFSPVVLAVFILYVRCAGCDPADPGVHLSKQAAKANHRTALMAIKLSQSNVETCLEHSHDESETNTSPYKTLTIEASGQKVCARWLCVPLACCKRDDPAKLNVGEQLLYCSICEAKISKNSKHCRACDKFSQVDSLCVYEFDHHCRWLNNCVGRRNYRTVVSLMVACLLLLVIVWTTRIGVLVRCFAQKTSFNKEIIRRLGSSFSRVSYIIVVVLLSVLAMLGTIPLGQLFFFHLILIHKGITTYDYILAVREQGIEQEIAEGDGFNSLTSSPASSNATGISGYSSSGALALHKGVFCITPRMFVEHQQMVLPVGEDMKSSGAKIAVNRTGKSAPRFNRKKSVGINPWKLARMNEEAAKAAAQARENSTITRPIIHSKDSSQVTETEDSNLEGSRNVSGEITVAGNNRNRRKHHDLAHLTGKERWLLMKDQRNKNVILHSKPGILAATNTSIGSPQSSIFPLPLEARNGFRCSPSRFKPRTSSTPRSYGSRGSRSSGRDSTGGEFDVFILFIQVCDSTLNLFRINDNC
nr:probable protein S-acyltransferase 22 [Physcomitrium patens]|eukprot:XP_024370381.1 probable protein S-acyltransferase 22 [Physcomitrella patens]